MESTGRCINPCLPDVYAADNVDRRLLIERLVIVQSMLCVSPYLFMFCNDVAW